MHSAYLDQTAPQGKSDQCLHHIPIHKYFVKQTHKKHQLLVNKIWNEVLEVLRHKLYLLPLTSRAHLF